MVTDLAWGAPLTEDDLATMPDDGHRYELIDGVLIVSPAPSISHQRCVRSLLVLLHAARQPEHEVLPAQSTSASPGRPCSSLICWCRERAS